MMTTIDYRAMQDAYEHVRQVADVAIAALRGMGRAGAISATCEGNTDAPLHSRDRSSITGGAPLPLAIIRAELTQLQERAERERWGYPADAAPEMAKLVLRLYVTEAQA